MLFSSKGFKVKFIASCQCKLDGSKDYTHGIRYVFMKREKQFPILLKVGVFTHVTTNVNQSHLGERNLLLDVHPPSALPQSLDCCV